MRLAAGLETGFDVPDPDELRTGGQQYRAQRHHRDDDDPRWLAGDQREGGTRPEGAADRAEAGHHPRHDHRRQQAGTDADAIQPYQARNGSPIEPVGHGLHRRGRTARDETNPVEETERHGGLRRSRRHEGGHREPRDAERNRAGEEAAAPATAAQGRAPQQPADRRRHHDHAGLGQHGHRQAQACGDARQRPGPSRSGEHQGRQHPRHRQSGAMDRSLEPDRQRRRGEDDGGGAGRPPGQPRAPGERPHERNADHVSGEHRLPARGDGAGRSPQRARRPHPGAEVDRRERWPGRRERRVTG